MPDDDRLIALEEKIAYLEQHVEALDGVVRDLADKLIKQGRGVDAVRELLDKHLAEEDAPGVSGDPAVDEKPPHW